MKRTVTASLITTLLVAGLTGCGGSDQTTKTSASTPSTATYVDPALVVAARHCNTVANPDDHGASLTFEDVGAEQPAWQTETPTGVDTLTGVACVLDELKTPKAVINHMDSTRALDGMQDDTWTHYKARWTYHPDDGLNLTVIDTSVK